MKFLPYRQAIARVPAKASGVYVIKAAGFLGLGSVLYVGESHSGRLKQTLSRHFQRWKGKTAGPTYPKDSLVFVHRTKPANAIDVQNAFIAELYPRDNTLGNPSWLDRLFGK
jgi:excinuclease UvrABC nuclease subunit